MPPDWPGSEPDADRHNLLLPQALHLLLTQQWARAGLMPVHACAFSIAGQGILALGDRGAGKSSLVLAALAAGARIVSDDWLLLGLDTDQVIQARAIARVSDACVRVRWWSNFQVFFRLI